MPSVWSGIGVWGPGHSSTHCCHDRLSAVGDRICGARRPSALSGGLSLTPGFPLHPRLFSSFCRDCWWLRQARASATALPGPVDGWGEQCCPHWWPLRPLGDVMCPAEPRPGALHERHPSPGVSPPSGDRQLSSSGSCATSVGRGIPGCLAPPGLRADSASGS